MDMTLFEQRYQHAMIVAERLGVKKKNREVVAALYCLHWAVDVMDDRTDKHLDNIKTWFDR